MLKAFVVQKLPKTLCLRLNRYIKSLSMKHKKCDECSRSYSSRPIAPAWNVLFFGTDDFSAESLTSLSNEMKLLRVVGHLEVVTSTKSRKPNPVQKIAKRENLTVHPWPLESVPPGFHIGLVASFGHLIPKRIIEMFPLFDVGPVLKQMACPIGPHDTAADVQARLARLGAVALLEVVRHLPHSLDTATPQMEDGATYAPKVTPALYCVDWQKMAAADVYNLCRALGHAASCWRGMVVRLSQPDAPSGAPSPAFRFSIPLVTADAGIGAASSRTPCRVQPAKSVPDECPTPGTVRVHKADARLRVMCADGCWLSFARVSIVGKRPMSAIDFYNGFLSRMPLADWILR